MAVDELQKINADRELRQLLELQEKEAHDLATLKEHVRQVGHARGHAQGLAEGRAKGLAEGFAEGLAEGRAEWANQAQVETIRLLVESGMSPEEVATRLCLPISFVAATLEQIR